MWTCCRILLLFRVLTFVWILPNGYTWSQDTVQGVTSVEYQLKQRLLRGYDVTSRPVRNDSVATPTVIGISLFHILDTNERHQTISALLSIRCYWEDEYLTWNRSEYDIKQFWIPAKSIWRPDLIITNYANDGYSDYMNTNAVVTWNGKVMWTFPIVVKIYCTLNVRYFPFDSQQCNMTMLSWTYDGFKLNLTHQPKKENKVYYLSTNQEWSVAHITPSVQIKTYPCCPEPFPLVTFTFNMHRRCLFYVINTICPCLLIYFVSFLGFFLPIESGEKVNLEITVLLALVVFLLMMSETMPPTPDAIPILGLLFAVTMIMVALAVVMAVTVTRVYFFKSTHEGVIPRWAHYFARMYQTRHKSKKTDKLPKGIMASMRRVDLDTRSLDGYEVDLQHIAQNSTQTSCSLRRAPAGNAGVPLVAEHSHKMNGCTGGRGYDPGDNLSTSPPLPQQQAPHLSPVATELDDEHIWQFAAFQMDHIFFWIFFFLTLIAFSFVFYVASPALISLGD